MNCPSCKEIKLINSHIGKVTIDSCSKCHGLWFDSDELRKSKDERLKDYNWFDFDLWTNKEQLRVESNNRICPKSEKEMYVVKYANSEIKIDACRVCGGIWLDQKEFEAVLKYINENASEEVLSNYKKAIMGELKEVFNGPESVKSEISDFLTLLDLFKYKFMVEHPSATNKLVNLPII